MADNWEKRRAEDVSYLCDKTGHKFDNLRIISKLPNDHHNLFHRHFIASTLSKHLID